MMDISVICWCEKAVKTGQIAVIWSLLRNRMHYDEEMGRGTAESGTERKYQVFCTSNDSLADVVKDEGTEIIYRPELFL